MQNINWDLTYYQVYLLCQGVGMINISKISETQRSFATYSLVNLLSLSG